MFMAYHSQATFAKSMSFVCGALRRDVLGAGSVSRLARVYSARMVTGSAYYHESVGNRLLGRPELCRKLGITPSRRTNTSPYSRSLLPSAATSFFSTKVEGNGSDKAFGPIDRTPIPEGADEACNSCCQWCYL